MKNEIDKLIHRLNIINCISIQANRRKDQIKVQPYYQQFEMYEEQANDMLTMNLILNRLSKWKHSVLENIQLECEKELMVLNQSKKYESR